jgi:hypothetical protein
MSLYLTELLSRKIASVGSTAEIAGVEDDACKFPTTSYSLMHIADANLFSDLINA